MPGVLALANRTRIKTSHRQRRKAASAHLVYILNNPLSGVDPTGYAACSLDDEASCLLQDGGVNTIVNKAGDTIATTVVADKGQNLTVTGNGGSISATFTGRTGDISRVLAGGPPSDIGAISQRTNGTLDGTAASYALGQDKSPGSTFDFMAADQQAQSKADFEAYRAHTFANEGLEPFAIHPLEAVFQTAQGTYNEIDQTGDLSMESAGTLAVSAMAAMLHVPMAGGRSVTKKAPHGNKIDSRPATLYEKYDKDGNFLKHGITRHENPSKRYTAKQINGGTVVRTDRGPRSEIVKKERDLVERDPGQDNREPWAGNRREE